MGRKRGFMNFRLRKSKDHVGHWIAVKVIDGRDSGFVPNPNPIPNKPNYIFASEQEAADAAVAAGFSPLPA